jgi:non-ribosomal peptide synthetase component E (peptide arylation enzyme)
MTQQAMRFPPELAARYLDDGLWRPETLDTWLARDVAAAPDAPAIIHPGGELSYAELADQVGCVAAGLADLGLGRGDIITTQLPNIVEALVAHLAIARIGAVHQTIHLPYGPADIEFHLAHSKARAVIAPAALKELDLAGVMTGLRDKLADLEHVIIVGEAPAGTTVFSSLAETGKPALLDGPAEAADPCMLLYTSGTTTSPKGVPLTFQNLLCNALDGANAFGFTSADRILSAAPFSHLYGIYNFHAALIKGAAAVLLPVFTPTDLAARVAAAKPTVMFLAPAHAAAVIGLGLMESHDFSSVRFTVFSGAACPVELLKRYHGFIPESRVAQLWGMTEIVAGCFSRPADSLEVAATSAGPPARGNEIRVLSPDGAALAAGEEGELQIRGPSVFAGYLDNPAANEDAFTAEGWFRTGDLASIDAVGYVRLTGRSKDIINRGGVKYNPADIEALLLRHDKIDQAAIVPMPDEILGERACCFIVPTALGPPTLAEVCDFLAAHDVTKYKWPERLETLKEMPLTPTRKIIKGRLAALLA